MSIHHEACPGTKRSSRAASCLALVALLFTVGRSAGAEEEKQAAGWKVGQRVETTMWRYGFWDQAWAAGPGQGLKSSESVQLVRFRVEFECTEVTGGVPSAGKSTYHEHYEFAPDVNLDTCLQGATVHYWRDAEGVVRWRVEDGRDLSPRVMSRFDRGTKDVHPRPPAILDVVKTDSAPDGAPTGIDALTAVLDMSGISKQESTLRLAEPDTPGGWTSFRGVLKPPSLDGWVEGGYCECVGSVLPASDARQATGGLVCATFAGSRVNGRVQHQWIYYAVSTRPLEARAEGVAARTDKPGAAATASAPWPERQRAVVESVPVDTGVAWQALVLDSKDRGPLLPAWIVRPGHSLRWLAADGSCGAVVEPLRDGPRAGLLVPPPPPEEQVAGDPSATRVRGTLIAGERVRGVLPDGKGGLLVRHWTVGELEEVEGEHRPLFLGLAESDAARGAWLLKADDGSVLGWTAPACAWTAEDLVWVDRDGASAAPQRTSPSLGASHHTTLTLPALDFLAAWIPSDDQDPEADPSVDVAGAATPEALLTAARLALAAGRLPDAKAAMQRLRAEWPTFDALLRNAGPTLRTAFTWSQSARFLNRHLLRLQTDIALLALPELGEVYTLGSLMQDAKRQRSALAIFRACLAERSDWVAALHGAAVSLLALERDQEVVDLLSKEPLTKEDPSLLVLLSDALVKLKRTEEARKLVEAFPAERRDGQVLDRLIRFAETANELEAAAPLVEAWLKLEPTDENVLYWVARLPYDAERWAEALASAKSGLGHHPKNAFLLGIAATSAHRLGDARAVSEFIERLEHVDEEHAERLKIELASKPDKR